MNKNPLPANCANQSCLLNCMNYNGNKCFYSNTTTPVCSAYDYYLFTCLLLRQNLTSIIPESVSNLNKDLGGVNVLNYTLKYLYKKITSSDKTIQDNYQNLTNALTYVLDIFNGNVDGQSRTMTTDLKSNLDLLMPTGGISWYSGYVC